MTITGSSGYFEDFGVGDIFEHQRGRTVTEFDNYAITHMSMNTAQTHFNRDYARSFMDAAFPDRLVAGPCTIALVVGLTSEDMSENALADAGMTAVRLPNPVFAGDTLYATSEVLEVRDSERPDAGLMRYRFIGRNSAGKVVAEGERSVLVRRRSASAIASRKEGASQ
ncbi:MAG TPA: MaoC family dehydratase [Rhodoblastus sp.]|nr:MaoC family dehydratase [Rhodoblastus sp.]